MAVYNSYSDYSTRRGGVIEGLGGGRKGKIGPIYTKVSNLAISGELVVARKVSRIEQVGDSVGQMSVEKRNRLAKDLDLGHVVRMRGGIFVRKSKEGLYEVYQSPEVPPERRVARVSRGGDRAVDRRAREDEAYEKLLAISQTANLRRKK